MKRGFAGVLLSVATAAALVGCGGEGHARRHEGSATAALPEPTPDTTPVEALRTPAGLALKPEQPAPTPGVSSGGAAPTAAAPTVTP